MKRFYSSAKKLPKMSYESFLKEREFLKTENDKLRFDYHTQLSKKEELVNKYMTNLKNKEIERFKKEHSIPTTEPFPLVKDKIEASNIYKILKKFPKGGLLHTHFLAMYPNNFLLQEGITLKEVKNI